MIQVIHVSDLHFGKSKKNDNAAKTLLQGIKERFFNSGSDRYLLVTGDITNEAMNEEYRQAYKALSDFAGKLLLTPGNHDWGYFFGTDYSEDRAKHFDEFACSLLFNHTFFEKHLFSQLLEDQGGLSKLKLLGLNSCTRTGLPDFAEGKIGFEQRIELKTKLAEISPEVPRLVFLHHIPNKDADLPLIMTLRDWEELMAIVTDKVEILAFGHQGKFIPLEKKSLLPAPSREMQIRSVKGDKRDTFLLDANNSVCEKRFYLITVDESNPPTVELCSI